MGAETAKHALESAWRDLVRDLSARLGAIRVASGRKPVRKLRKTVRRLRFVVRTWRDAFDNDERRLVAHGLKALSGVLSPARDAAVPEMVVGEIVADCDRKGVAHAGDALVRRLRDRRLGAIWPVVDAADRWFASGL
ncbi:MAG: CHAD domain-containing protein, partial [Planctomycetes bacterium]|nr:CHAD domain-containing protein [Planctomycetota bacterium]